MGYPHIKDFPSLMDLSANEGLQIGEFAHTPFGVFEILAGGTYTADGVDVFDLTNGNQAAKAGTEYSIRSAASIAQAQKLENGMSVTIGGHTYIRQNGATGIPDALNLIPVQPYHSSHWGVKIEAANQDTAFNAMGEYISTNGGGKVSMLRGVTGIVLDQPIFYERVIYDFNTRRIEEDQAPSILWENADSGGVVQRGVYIHDCIARPNTTTYFGIMFDFDEADGGGDANIDAPVRMDRVACIGSPETRIGGNFLQGVGFNFENKVTFSNFEDCYFADLEYGVYVRPANFWFNDNNFTRCYGIYCKFFVTLEVAENKSSGSQAAVDNTFTDCAFQGTEHCKRIFQIIGGRAQRNRVDIVAWDTHNYVPQDGEEFVTLYDLGNGLPEDNVLSNIESMEVVRDPTVGNSGLNTIVLRSVQKDIGFRLPSNGRYSPADFGDDNFAYAADPQNPYWTVTSSTVDSGSIRGPFDRSTANSAAGFTGVGANDYKYVSLAYLDNSGASADMELVKGMMAQFITAAPSSLEFWYSSTANPDHSQLELDDKSLITDWQRFKSNFDINNDNQYGENSLYVHLTNNQITGTFRHIAIRFLVPDGVTCSLSEFCGVLPLVERRGKITADEADFFGDATVKRGRSWVMESSNGAGVGSIRILNNGKVDIIAPGGLSINGVDVTVP